VADQKLRIVVRTPEGCVLDDQVGSLRVPTNTGQVGLRPRCEPTALIVEPGLALAEGDAGLLFVATAGGLLRCDGRMVVLLTPVAVLGNSAETVQAELESALGTSSADLELRSVLQRLETGILQELRRSSPEAAGAKLD
jgi:F0F1-type ATP synthase epsilon subunit